MTYPTIQLPAFAGHTVRVSLINGARTHIPSNLLVEAAASAPVPKYLKLADYSFLIESEKHGQKYLFDLAMMRDVENRMPPALQALMAGADNGGIDEQDEIHLVLQQHGVALDSIDGIILSHGHIDHVGDPSVFPSSTKLIVGPGFKQNPKLMPGYPTDPDAFMLSSAFEGREVMEVDFKEHTVQIGGLRAVDFLRDGSLYLLHAPGHTPHHMMALARTSPESWVLMAGDSCHSVAQLRPSTLRPLPQTMPAGAVETNVLPPSCSCGRLRQLLPRGPDSPFYGSPADQHEDRKVAVETTKTVVALDGLDAVFVILAHDATVLNDVDCFPAPLNGWEERQWAEKSRWRFVDMLLQPDQ